MTGTGASSLIYNLLSSRYMCKIASLKSATTKVCLSAVPEVLTCEDLLAPLAWKLRGWAMERPRKLFPQEPPLDDFDQ